MGKLLSKALKAGEGKRVHLGYELGPYNTRKRREGYLKNVEPAIEKMDIIELREKMEEWFIEEWCSLQSGNHVVNWQELIELTENYPKIREEFSTICVDFRESLARSLRGGEPGITEADVIEDIKKESRERLKKKPIGRLNDMIFEAIQKARARGQEV